MIQFRILQSKLLFLHHLVSLSDDSLAKEVIAVQERLALPGLVQECHGFIVKFGITKVEKYTKNQWKTLVKTKIMEMNKHAIIEQSLPYKKINLSADEKFERQSYIKNLNISEARMQAKMTPTIQMNFQSDAEFTRNLWTCSGCKDMDNAMGDKVVGNRDTQQHVMVCPGYADYRDNKNFDDDRDLVRYFQQVINKRLDTDDL